MREIFLQPDIMTPRWGMDRIRVYKTLDKIEVINMIVVREFDKKRGLQTRSCLCITIIEGNSTKISIKEGFK